MTTFLAMAVLVMGIVTVVNLVLLFAVIRRLRATEGSLALPHLPAIGQPVGRFSVRALDSTQISDRDLALGSTIVGFVTPGCGPCKDLTQALQAEPWTGPLPVIFVTGPAEEAHALAEALASAVRTALVPEGGEVAGAFGGIEGYPTLVRVLDGVVVAAGRSLESVAEEAAFAGQPHR